MSPPKEQALEKSVPVVEKRTKAKKRRPQERAEQTRESLLNAALTLFSERGYDGVTMRDIEVSAGVQRGLLGYHFDDKETLWKRVIDHLFGLLKSHVETRMELLAELPPRESVAFIIRSYVRFSAQHPELNRLMNHEGKTNDWRLQYIVEEHIRRTIEPLKTLVENGIGVAPEKFAHWYYVFVGGTGLFFSVAPEVQALFGLDPQAPEFVEEHAQFLIDCLLN